MRHRDCQCIYVVLSILVVGTRADRVDEIARLLKAAGHDVVTALAFHDAIRVADQRAPELVISEVRLGAFNGLHLAIRYRAGQQPGRVILIDTIFDSVLEQDAERVGAVYVVEPVEHAELLEHVARIPQQAGTHRRWPRKKPAGDFFLTVVAGGTVRVLDLSYGGLRLEVLDPCHVESGIDVTTPEGVQVRAKAVWTSPTPSGQYWCGAELSESNPQALSVWRRLVDSVHI